MAMAQDLTPMARWRAMVRDPDGAEWPITASHPVRVATLPWVHRDPFDRLPVAQAMDDGLSLLTADATLKRYGRFVTVV